MELAHVPRVASTNELRDVFERFGKVRDVYMPVDFYTKQPRGYAFVEFLDRRDAADAQADLDRTRVGGRDITVIFAKVCMCVARPLSVCGHLVCVWLCVWLCWACG